MSSTEQFSGRRYIVLESYKKNGEAKLTPVQSLYHDGSIYVRTDPTTWKVKRIRRNPHVRIELSDRSGKPLGDWVEGEARLLEGAEREEMIKVFRNEYGAFGYSMVGFVGRLRGEKQMTAIISINFQPHNNPR